MRRGLLLSAGALVALFAFGAVANAAPPEPNAPAPPRGGTIYDSTVRPLPGNLVSQAFQATQMSEFGDEVTFVGPDRVLKSVTVTLSSWGCQTGSWFNHDCVTAKGATFAQPVTFNIYAPAISGGGVPVPGALLETTTQTFAVPYRPSSDNVHCTGGEWYDGKQGCFNGLATNITFDYTNQNVVLPNTVVYGVSINTSNYGPHPIGNAPCDSSSAGCPYDSLNVALSPQVVTGSKPFPNTVFQNTATAANYCDNGADGVGLMRLDSRSSVCWAGYIPAVRFEARHEGPEPNPEGLTLNEEAISAEQCQSPGSHVVVDVTYRLTNDYDSGFGGNAWANDTVQRHLVIWQHRDGTFCARADDHATFVTFAGVSPSGNSTVGAGITGEFHGGYVTNFFVGTLNAKPPYATHGELGTFDLHCTDAYTCPGAHPSYTSYFSSSTGDTLAHWGWIYHAGRNGTWLDQDNVPAADSGDIVGS
jgi:hypothetical protein